MKKITPVVATLLVLTLPVVAFAAASSLKELVGQIVTLLNKATGVLVAAALVLFLYGAAYNMIRSGERGGGALRKFMVWGVIILFVMVSIWGILRVLQDTLFNTNSAAGDTSVGGGTTSNISF